MEVTPAGLGGTSVICLYDRSIPAPIMSAPVTAKPALPCTARLTRPLACLPDQATWTTPTSLTELLTGSTATGSATTAKERLWQEKEILENLTTTNTYPTTARTSHGDKGKRNGRVRGERRPKESGMAWKTTHDDWLYLEFVAQGIHGTNGQQLGYVDPTYLHTFSYIPTDPSTNRLTD